MTMRAETDARRHAEWLPPLLRGIGTLLIVVASALVLVAEQREAAASIQAAQAEPPEAPGDAAVPVSAELAPLLREVRLLRQQVEHDDLGEQVLENREAQLVGLLGSLLIAGSFLLEAWQKQRRAGSTGASQDAD